ncbi:hypothetical protein PCC7424_1567 [Gloeothece citriformis PCC 7424]|uniref:Uncharacterized protein n=1 Tax=Gloeothece citriformis (strain PCC 7424) TaxID=65393 RepID=B7K9N8_GLOC7|nr:hypothetical protein [Gloeothece citriformis]ACK70006.1 hypothetical protein PCC7424_1567 [Gloeothece citriformis PCC 7424]
MSEQFKFILERCSTNQQKELLIQIKSIILQDSRVKEFPETRHIKYGSNQSNIFAEIIFLKKWEHPKLFLTLPRVNNQYQITKNRCRYAININPDGTIPEIIYIYQVKKIKYDNNSRRFSSLLKALTENSIDDTNNLEQLIKLTLDNNLKNL